MTMSQGTVPASVRIHRWRGVAAVTLTAGELQATFVPEMNMLGASVPGGVIAFYQLGYGIAAFGAGPLQDAGVGFRPSSGSPRWRPWSWAGCPSFWPPDNPRRPPPVHEREETVSYRSDDACGPVAGTMLC
jgi:hypothetical protein